MKCNCNTDTRENNINAKQGVKVTHGQYPDFLLTTLVVASVVTTVRSLLLDTTYPVGHILLFPSIAQGNNVSSDYCQGVSFEYGRAIHGR